MKEAAALHEKLFTIDTHIDTPTARLMRDDWDFAEAHEVMEDGSQCDLPRMRAGGIDALVMAVYSAQGARTPEGYAVAHERALQVFQRTREVIERNASACGLALTAADAVRLKLEQRRAFYLSIENSYPLGLEIGNVAKFHALGMRMLGLQPVGIEWDAAACATRAAAGHLTIRADLATYRPHHEPGSVWGTDVYTADSSICTAAVHAGLIDPAEGGPVAFEVVAGEDAYEGSTAHGVTTRDYGPYDLAFRFADEQPDAAPEQDAA